MSTKLVATDQLKEFSDNERDGSAIHPQLWAKATKLIRYGEDLNPILGRSPKRGFSGAIAFQGVDLRGTPHPYVQVKLLNPEELPVGGGKSAPKYQSPSRDTGRHFDCFLAPGIEGLPEVLDKFSFELPDDVGFWKYIADHPEVDIVLTEGAKKGMVGLSYGIVTIAIPGVWMAIQGEQLTPLLGRFAHPDRKWKIAFDADLRSNRQVSTAFFVLSNHLLQNNGGTVYKSEWPIEMGKGMDDFILDNGIEAFREVLERSIPMEEVDGLLAPPHESVFGNQLVEQYRKILVWDGEHSEWMQYSATPEAKGIWSRVEDVFIRQMIQATADSRAYYYRSAWVGGVYNILQNKLAGHGFKGGAKGYLPCKNGLLNLETKVLSPYTEGDRATWKLSLDYDPKATCEPILDWMKSALGSTQVVNLVGAFFSMVLTGDNLQKYIELIGPGGTGKSTLIKLLTALVGYQNTHTTALEKLGSRFETANFKGKKLAVIMDADKFLGSTDILKSLVAMETLPYERKFQNATQGFIPECGVIVAANEIPQTSDNTSGLKRRRITLYMNKVIADKDQRELIEIDGDGEVKGEFAPYLPGLLNWVLSFNQSDRHNYLKRTREFCPAVTQYEVESLISTNPLASWIDSEIVLSREGRVKVGVANRDPNGGYEKSGEWLYPSYKAYCEATGVKSINLRRFSNLVLDLFRNQLKTNLVTQSRDRDGSHFYGIRIREDHDDDLPSPINELLTSDIPLDDLTYPSQPVRGCDGYVKAETIGRDGCEGYEGYIKTPSIRECVENIQPISQKKECSDIPHQLSHSSPARVPAITEPSPTLTETSPTTKTTHQNQEDIEEVNAIEPPIKPFPKMGAETARSFLRAIEKCSWREEVDEIKSGINELYGQEGLKAVARMMTRSERQFLLNLPSSDF